MLALCSHHCICWYCLTGPENSSNKCFYSGRRRRNVNWSILLLLRPKIVSSEMWEELDWFWTTSGTLWQISSLKAHSPHFLGSKDTTAPVLSLPSTSWSRWVLHQKEEQLGRAWVQEASLCLVQHMIFFFFLSYIKEWEEVNIQTQVAFQNLLVTNTSKGL